ncbi:hypothetical protein ACJMK2_037185 [Sinanodonta woodiana]|uniref:UBX domain-containing protein 1 n=1 Tax=Sinanodonta woodiana TaxID=1069815 RepID=A0ABD3WN17_SINWO
MSSDLNVLIEMGFSQNRAAKALHKTGYKSVQVAMDWLFAHDDDPDIDEPFEAPQGHVLGQDEQSSVSIESGSQPVHDNIATEEQSTGGGDNSAQPPQQALSLMCDECGKRFRNEDEVQFHAAKTNHTSFSESTEDIKPLTEEEKRAQVQKLQEKLKQKRLEKEEQERKEQIAREKQRRTFGKDVTMVKQKMEEDEIKKLAEQKRREKMEEKLARQKVKEEIEKDRRERAAKFGKPQVQASSVLQATPSSTNKQMAEQKDYTESKLQIRLTNGQALTHSFSAREPLAAVRLYVEMNRTDGSGSFSLMTSFPRKVFTTDDMEKPLIELGLVPSAVLIVTHI